MKLRFLQGVLLAVVAVVAVACGPDAEKPPVSPSPAGSASARPVAVAADAGAASQESAGVADLGPIPVFPDDPQSGNRTARVTIVEFSDLQCPYCARADATMAQVAEQYDADSVRIAWKHYPLSFHEHARALAEAAQGVMELGGSGAFWNFVHTAYTNQKDEGAPHIIARWATRAGVDGAAIEEGVRAKRWAERVERDMKLGGDVGVNGTPAFFVNGVLVSGAQPFEAFKEVIDRELQHASALEKSGVPRDRLYATATTENKKHTKSQDELDEEEEAEEERKLYKVPIGASPVRGAATAKVTIVEFSDFECPFCKKVEDTLKKVREKYGADVRFVWKDTPLPFHHHAEPAAELAREARAEKGDVGFWDVHDRLFDVSPKLDEAALAAVAKDAGLDAAKSAAAIKSKKYAPAIEVDEDAADDFQAIGTPHFFINGHRIVGAQPLEKFSSIIDDELHKADAQLAKGTAAANVYDALIADGAGAPEIERKSVPPNPTAPFRGPATAKITIQEFADFQCPYCKRAEETMTQILAAYPTQVKIMWRNMPLSFHKDAQLAAEFALEVRAQKGNAGFYAMQKKMFEHQAEDAGLERPALESYAKELGCDMKKLAASVDARAHQSEIDRDTLDAQNAHINGTPAFIINGYYVSGAQPFRRFKRVIERALHEPPPPAAGTFGKVDVTVGTGREAKAGDTVRVHYTGTLTDGKVFDSSRTRNVPFEFTIGRGMVIRGWEEGIVGMKVGGKRKLTLPPEYGYGANGHPPVIPPAATLIFDVELLEIK